ncbi:hypothetical protein OPT61_g8829 [Boeremia exigua]|uniref:Uncharacterized protein n=1 Tax=Boeremia exigua TaxID=749465 RepID=A0ACC2HXR0_9PLEO|nr:hypothetical protein OPT61_g8829 [Boeremia exigua]
MDKLNRGQNSSTPESYQYETSLATIRRVKGDWDTALSSAVRLLCEQIIHFSEEEEADFQSQAFDYETEVLHKDELRELLHASQHVKKRLEVSEPGFSLKGTQPVRIYPSLIQTLYCVALCEQVRDDANLGFVQKVLEKLHNIFCRKLGEKHRLTVKVEFDLAVNHRLSGDFERSLQMIKAVMYERRENLKTDHPDYLLARHQYAVTLFGSGFWRQALTEQAATLKAQEFLLGTDHADTTISRYTLAIIYHSLNQNIEANSLIEQVIEEQRQRYRTWGGPNRDHSIVVHSRARHALILLELGKFTEAESEQLRVYRWRCDHFGEHHNLTRSARNDLAQINQALIRHGTARDMYIKLLNSFDLDKNVQLKDKSENPLKVLVLSNLASCYFEMGDYKAAEEIQDRLLQRQSKNDERVIAATFNLALTRKMLGHMRNEGPKLGAFELLQIAIKRTEKLGPEHPQAAELQATLQAWRREADPQYDWVLDLPSQRNQQGEMYNSNIQYSRQEI